MRLRNEDWLLQVGAAAAPPASPTRPATVTRSACAAAPASASASSAPATGSASSSTASFAGEINLNAVQRGPFQNAYVGYWIDEAKAGRQRLRARGRRGADPLRVRGAAPAPPADRHHPPQREPAGGWSRSCSSARRASPLRYLEINGVWEDHVRYAITAEEWEARREELAPLWLP